MRFIVIFIIMFCFMITGCSTNSNEMNLPSKPKISSHIQLSASDKDKLTKTILDHFNYANHHDWEKYTSTLIDKYTTIRKDNPIFLVWRKSQTEKFIVSEIIFDAKDNVGRPRVMANVKWNDRINLFFLQKYGDVWKISGIN